MMDGTIEKTKTSSFVTIPGYKWLLSFGGKAGKWENCFEEG